MPERPRAQQTGVLAVLDEQHAQIRTLLTLLERTQQVSDRQLHELGALLAAHEEAEQQVVHPVVEDPADGPEITAGLVAQEQRLAAAWTELEAMDLDDRRFRPSLQTFAHQVRAHLDNEERHEFPALRDAVDTAQLEEMAVAVRAAVPSAPDATLEPPGSPTGRDIQ